MYCIDFGWPTTNWIYSYGPLKFNLVNSRLNPDTKDFTIRKCKHMTEEHI